MFIVLAWCAGRDQPPLAVRDWAAVAGLGFCGYFLASFLDFAGLAYVTASLERPLPRAKAAHCSDDRCIAGRLAVGAECRRLHIRAGADGHDGDRACGSDAAPRRQA
jgi:hypothetical protein